MQLKQKAKEIKFKGEELKKLTLETLKKLSDLVGVTLGPGGNPVLIERPGQPPLVTKDGVTVADSISLLDSTEYVIAEAAKEVCQRTNREAGDGTTTAIVLADAITSQGIEYLKNHSAKSPQELCRELNLMVNEIVDTIKNNAITVNSSKDLKKVALISSNSDEEIADAVVEAVEMVGEDGTIIAEEGSGRETTVELREGFPVGKGLSSFSTIQSVLVNNPHDQECVYDLPYVLLYDGDLTNPTELGIALNEFMSTAHAEKEVRPILIVAHKFSPQVQRLIAVNVQSNVAQLCPLETKATAQPNSRQHMLHDLAAFTGAKVFDPITNKLPSNESVVNLNDLGQVGSSRIGKYRSILFDSPTPDLVNKRIEILKRQKSNAESEFDAELIKERISQLSGGIATIYVGGSSDLEMREKKHRIEDTINAVRSAIEMGVVPGGGATLLGMANSISKKVSNSELPQSATILSSAFAVPFCRIMQNAGETGKNITEVVSKVTKSGHPIPTKVYDSLRHTLVNPTEGGIIDPAKVTVTAVTNALSIATMLMTLGGTVVIPRDKQEEAQAEAMAQQIANQMQGV